MTGQVPLLQVDGLVRDYPLPRHSLFRPTAAFRALHGVGFTVEAGRSFGIVGESGCGKSTLARAVMALERPTQGRVRLKGSSLFDLPPAQLQALRRHFQMVVQDPYGSLDPRHKVARIVAEPLAALVERDGRTERRRRVDQALGEVGLKSNDGDKYPHEFSGGQRQRIAIARALITRPELIVADEPVSALDVSVQAQVLNLMMDLQERHDLTYLFIGHDLSVVRHVTDQVAVMYLGRIVEQGPTAAVFAQAAHPYTQALLAAVPKPDPARRRGRRTAISDAPAPPGQEAPAAGCPFAPRCPLAEARCRQEEPALRPLGAGRLAACHLA